ncbi:PREDICTED: UDP-N-acetylglucosamine transferase subunit ALG14 [Polistes dominula]|uniref:UDP-N-acetylglucosamine transferase subunit ALG14 n=1 Tax=Polistes dominula TaxID=743375 RepID=A0ABM1ICV4_POLDO|nr:PREDICTED: UDP-N-acetylglucosamine transferase subunit ALG14 [Polistes dominula]
MVLTYIHIILIVCPLIIILRIVFLILMKDKKTSAKKKLRVTPAKTMIILGSGGHTAEMLRIVKLMDYKMYTPRIYVSASTDNISIDKVKVIEENQNDYKIIRITRSREVGQSYISSVWTTLMATLEATSILWSEKPELLLCNGPGTCVPLCIVTFVFKIFYTLNITTVFIESYCRVKTFSLSAIILYYFVDHIIVRWPFVNKSLYDKVFTCHN